MWLENMNFPKQYQFFKSINLHVIYHSVEQNTSKINANSAEQRTANHAIKVHIHVYTIPD